MGIKIDLDSNIDLNKLNVQSCRQLIATLEDAYRRTRGEMYSLFLGRRVLQTAITVSLFCLLLYAVSSSIGFVYAALIIFVAFMVLAIIGAEMTTKALHKQFREKIQLLNGMLENLKKRKEYNVK